jgi:hypothetical protein
MRAPVRGLPEAHRANEEAGLACMDPRRVIRRDVPAVAARRDV